MSEFIFNEELHRYTLDGEVLPSVTTVINNGLHTYAAVPKELLERAARFGTSMHLAIKLYLADDLDEDSLDPPLKGCLDGFKRWVDDYRDEYHIDFSNVEVPGYHKRLKYAGTPDIEMEEAVIDLKSRPISMLTDPIQLTAYDHMTGGGNRPCYILELKQDSTYVFTSALPTRKSAAEAWSRFRYLLDYYNMGKQIELWRK